MKYWFFDGSDVVGPFSPQELLRRKGFSVSNSLVCPENFSEDEDSWKTASSFADFGRDGQPVPSAPAAEPTDESTAEEAALFDKEMDTFLKNPSILAGTAEPAPDGPALEMPKKPAKPGPIEDYFNNINSEDLGSILGIPEPNENSDMNLPRAFEKEFEETVPPSDKEIDFVEADAEETEEPAAAEDSSAETADVPVPPNSAAPQTAEVPRRVRPEEPASVKLAQEETPVTISVVEENAEPVLVLPAHQDQNRQADTASVPAEEDSAPAEETPSGPEPEQEPEPENLSTCTLPLIGAENETVSLPSIPKDGVFRSDPVQAEEELFVPIQDLQEPIDTIQVALEPAAQVSSETETASAPQPLPKETDNPASTTSTRLISAEETLPEEPPQTKPAQGSATEPEELVPAATHQQGEQQTDLRETVCRETTAPTQEDPREQTVRDILRGKLTVPAEEELKEPLKALSVEPEVNQIKPKLNQTPEITRFLDTQSRIIRRSRNKKADMMLWILACLLALGVLYAIVHLVTPRPAVSAAVDLVSAAAPSGPVSVTHSAATASSAVPQPVPVHRETEVKPVLPPAPLTAADKALAAVQNYRLSGDRGTIASYFDRIYKTKLSQGYTGNWSAEALHKNIYIVKYRLSKTRLEPVVYVFQADAAREKLTGALNNAALDLVGKI